VKATGLGDGFLLDGYDLSGDVGAISSLGGGPALSDVTVMNQSAFARIGTVRDGQMSFSAFMNDASGRAHARLKTLPRADVIATYLRGTTLGNASASLVAKQADYDGTRDTSGSLTYTIDLAGTGYGLEWGAQLTPGARTDASPTAGATLDRTGPISSGAVAYLHVTAVSGGTVTVTVEDSADASSWATIGTFTAASSPGAQRIEIAGTVRRYVRATSAGSFSSATFFAQISALDAPTSLYFTKTFAATTWGGFACMVTMTVPKDWTYTVGTPGSWAGYPGEPAWTVVSDVTGSSSLLCSLQAYPIPSLTTYSETAFDSSSPATLVPATFVGLPAGPCTGLEWWQSDNTHAKLGSVPLYTWHVGDTS
jgi:hypothetical protein